MIPTATTSTVLTNPGIISRLQEDIRDYLSPFGFRLINDVIIPSSTVKSIHRAELVVPNLNESLVVQKTLHLHISHEALWITAAPLIRTFLRLSECHLHPKQLRCIIHCNFVIPVKERQNHDQKQQESLILAARRMAHHIHMLVRNSMGSALCIDLIVILPLFQTAHSHLNNNNDNCNGSAKFSTEQVSDNGREILVPVPKYAVLHAMTDNTDVHYPSVKLVQQVDKCNCDGQCCCSYRTSTDSFVLHLNICSRMCTVRHQPTLFQWLTSSSSHYTSLKQNSDNKLALKTIPPFILVACIEKVANLHRILMLCYDYDRIYLCSSDTENTSRIKGEKRDTHSYDTNDSSGILHSNLLLPNLIVVMPNPRNGKGDLCQDLCVIDNNNNSSNQCNNHTEHNKDFIKGVQTNYDSIEYLEHQQSLNKSKKNKTLREHYVDAIDHFHSVVLDTEKMKKMYSTSYRPLLVYEENNKDGPSSVDFIISTIHDHIGKLTISQFKEKPDKPVIVGIDNHPQALILHANYDSLSQTPTLSKSISSNSLYVDLAQGILQNASALLFGYESTGIPIQFQKMLSAWVQIPCRSSINVVAAMSIILDAALKTSVAVG